MDEIERQPISDEWAALLEGAEAFRGADGHPIDEKIQPLVAALWGQDFDTRWSCEGHLEWGYHAPFVYIAKGREQAGKLATRERAAWAQGERVRLQVLLDGFYAVRDAPPDVELVVTLRTYERDNGEKRSVIHLVNRQFLYDPGLRSIPKRLDLFQVEMRAFAEFLAPGESLGSSAGGR